MTSQALVVGQTQSRLPSDRAKYPSAVIQSNVTIRRVVAAHEV